jgi:5'-nucleotidase
MRAKASIVSFAALALLVGACSSSSDDSSSTEAPAATVASETTVAATTPETTAVPTTAAPTTAAPTTAAPEPLRIMVTNDDGVAAEGISVLVDALTKVPNVEVTVIAPKENKSGSGDTITPGPLAATDATTKGGHAAKAVDGFPADTVIYAFEQGGLPQKPDLVVSGINQGQNIGPAIPLSGTVGAALTAAKAGVPALAVSQQVLKDPAPVPPDYPTAARLVVEWIAQNQAAIEGGTLTPDVFNLNVPTCQGGAVRGVAEVKPATDLAGRDYLAASDCASPVTITSLPTDDLDALIRGYASLSQLDPASIVGVG